MKKLTQYMNEGNKFPQGEKAFNETGKEIGVFYKMASTSSMIWLTDSKGDYTRNSAITFINQPIVKEK